MLICAPQKDLRTVSAMLKVYVLKMKTKTEKTLKSLKILTANLCVSIICIMRSDWLNERMKESVDGWMII